MSLKIKILILAIVPLLLVTAMITLIVLHQARKLGEQEIQIFESNLFASKKTELKHYVDLALTSISHVHDLPELDPAEAQAQVKSILHNLTFGEDGYFFVYDENGVGLVHPQQPEIVGQNLIDLQDENGGFLMRSLLAIAKEGGGYYRYRWRKPSIDGDADKLSYVVQLPNWKWMLGTGLYVDDIAHEVAKIRAEVDKDIRETFITVLVITSVTVVIIVLIGIAFNLHGHLMADAKLRELAQRYIQFQISERRRFSRELHDGINQLMVSVKLRIDHAITRISQGDYSAFEELSNLEELSAFEELQQGQMVLNDAIQEVRRISHDLRPTVLDDLGLLPALNSLLEQFSQRTDIRVERTLNINNDRLPEQIEITLYRVVQDSLKNIEQHADASVIHLVITEVDDMIQLEISDNGCGFTPEEEETTQGAGLITMRERVELLGGIFSTASEPGNGTLLKAELNLNG